MASKKFERSFPYPLKTSFSFSVVMRGFVGPIGDDIPSIFPIVAGVLLFIGTLAYVNNLVQQKNDLLEVRKAALSLSYLVTEKGRLESKDFLDLCSFKVKPLASSNQVNFIITFKRFCEGVPNTPKEKEDAFYLSREETGPSYSFCTSLNPEPKQGLFSQPKDAVIYSYPIAVPCPKANSPTSGLGQINVIAWRGRE